MQINKSTSAWIALPWILTAIFFISLVIGAFMYQGSNPFEIQQQKTRLIATMRIQLLQAIESEKNAVLAIKIDSAQTFATQARQALAAVESSRRQLETLLPPSGSERELAGKFKLCWTQFRQLDQTVLDLATQNTNIRAQELSASRSAAQIEVFEAELNRLRQKHPSNDRPALEALVAALKIYALHKVHIEAAQDAEMNRIEAIMQGQDSLVRSKLQELEGLAEPAAGAYRQFMLSHAEVLKLSRQNTNIKSVGLSLDKKHLVSAQCQENLSQWQALVQAQASKATR